MSRKRTYRDIEDDLNEERAQLGSIFDSLFSRSTVDMLAREAMRAVQTNGGVRETAEAVIRRNPAAVGVMGLGLAWLLVGSTRKPGPKGEAEAEASHLHAKAHRATHQARAAARDEAEAAADTDWAEALDALRARATKRLHELEEDAATYSAEFAAGLHGRTEEARDYMAERAAILADLAEDMRERIATGLDDASHAARARILTAREEAYAARLKAQEALGRGGREAKRIVEDHPMVSAAVALALSAAIGAAVHRSRRSPEDHMAEDLEEVGEAIREDTRARLRRHKRRH